MAEATVERPPGIFYCHECMSEVRPNIPAFTCSRCNSGFIEEVEEPALPSQSFIDPQNSDSVVQFAELLGAPLFEPLGTSGIPPWNLRHRTRLSAISDDVDMEEDDIRGVAPSAVFHFSSADPQPGQQTIHGIINYVIQHLGSDLRGRTPLILRGNPADYAWGPNGLDAIISQLLNHLEGTGAPPAQKEKIDNLPRIVIEKGHVDNMLQCSICMDDFELGKEARKLPCDHLYHSECIVKWLEMHGTCPVCRKDLNGEDTSTNEAEFTSGFHLNAGGGNATASSSSSTTSLESTPSSSFSQDWRN